MNIIDVRGVRIDGVVACLPQNRLSTRESCLELYGEKGVETLEKATGIEARYVASPGTTALDLGCAAAVELLGGTGTDKGDIGAVICVTFTQEYPMPADAVIAQARLGLSNECIAFDVNMACSGYGYGLYIGSMLAKSIKKKVLVLDGDVQSAFTSPLDKATMPVLSDVGTATLLSPCGDDVWKFAFYTDGSLRDILFIPAGGSKHPTTEDDVKDIAYPDGSHRKNIDLYMDGFGVFKFVAITASRFINGFMKETGLSADDLDVFVPHQANIYMIGELAKKLKISKDKMWKSGDVFGNPGSASVPLTIAKNARSWFEINGIDNARTLFSGFGGGMSISVGGVCLKKDAYYAVIDYGCEENQSGREIS